MTSQPSKSVKMDDFKHRRLVRTEYFPSIFLSAGNGAEYSEADIRMISRDSSLHTVQSSQPEPCSPLHAQKAP